MKSLMAFLTSFALLSCEPDWVEPFDTFVIGRGNHGVGLKTQMLQSHQLSFSALFDETAIYTTKESENQWDINKLLGFSDCNSHHHANSARFGWRWVEERLEIHAYCYVQGQRVTKYLGEVELNEINSFKIILSKDEYQFILNGNSTSIERRRECNVGAYYMLWPYFGGDEKAPHDIIIKININY